MISPDSAGLPPGIRVVRAANPGPMTLDGTNTWVVSTDEGNVVIDPGPDLRDHMYAVAVLGPVTCAILTHRHPDHSAGAQSFHRLTGAPVLARDQEMGVGGEPLPPDGAVVSFANVELRVLDTPGHTSDSVCLTARIDDQRVVFTGDTVLGRGSTIVAHPDGTLGDYLESLTRLHNLTKQHRWLLLPGHGPVRTDAHDVVGEYIAHRRERLDQVRAALAEGAESARDVVEAVYADVDRSLWPAAEATVRAQLSYLGHGET